MITLDERDSGRRIEASVGDVISVRLHENPTTGYRWAVETSAGLELTENSFQNSGVAGAAGFRLVQLRIIGRGTAELRLKHWREWQGDTSAIDRFVVTIVAT